MVPLPIGKRSQHRRDGVLSYALCERVPDPAHRRMVGFLILTQCGAVKARSRCFETTPSGPNSHAFAEQVRAKNVEGVKAEPLRHAGAKPDRQNRRSRQRQGRRPRHPGQRTLRRGFNDERESVGLVVVGPGE